jgi:DNA modification methylase
MRKLVKLAPIFNSGRIEDINNMPYKKTDEVIQNIKKLEWTEKPYSVQSWGNWLHRMSPYVGRIKPSFAHFLIKHATNEKDTILDPFCGIGTIPTEAALMGRKSFGIDLNPYAYAIARAKQDNKREKDQIIGYLESIVVDTSDTDISDIPDWVKEYYNQDTLREIVFLREKFKKSKHYFLLGTLIGISQGHRPGHLSKPCAWTLPYKPRPDDKGEYRESIPRLIAKVGRTYSNGFQSMGEMKISYGDARKIKMDDSSVDHIISSPPYYDTLDYVGSSRLRLAITGHYDEVEKKKMRNNLIQKYNNYLEEMEICIKEMQRVLKKGGYCILIVGDCFKSGKVINTAEELKPIMESVGFKCHAIVQDEIPMNKSVQKKSTEQKHDRVMILTKK